MKYDLQRRTTSPRRTRDERIDQTARPAAVLTGSSAVLALQKLAGNRATVAALQRAPDPAAKAPVPVAVRNGPKHGPIDDADAVGMSIAITLTSSSGRDEDMANVQDSEQVSTSFNHKGSYKSVDAFPSRNTEYMPGYPIPDDAHAEEVDRIFSLADHHGGSGSYERQQLDTFKAPAAGVTDPQAIPNSGYLIRRTIIVHGGQIKFRVEKSPQACTVKGFSSEAGPSPAQRAEVVVRP